MPAQLSQFNNKLLLCVLLTPLMLSCSIASSNNVKKDIVIDAWQYNKSDLDFDKLTNNAVKFYGQELINLVPKDIKDYCPKYKKAKKGERIKFWSALISSLSYFESTHSPDVSYTEKFTNLSGKAVVSRGLLQISQESANGYDCNITQDNQLHKAQVNLECGVKILTKLITKDGIISDKKQSWLGAAKYWSPFRDDKKKQIITANTKKQSYCQ